MSDARAHKIEAGVFEPIRKEHTEEYLVGILTRSVKAFAWTIGQKRVLHTRVISYRKVFNVISVCLSKGPEEKAFIEGMQTDRTAICFFRVELPSGQIFFSAEYKKDESSFYNFRVDETIYRVQRRKDIRIPFPDPKNNALKITYESGDTEDREILNISAGGLVFETFEKASHHFKGAKVQSVIFKIFDLTIDTQAEIKHVSEVKSPGRKPYFKVGLKFFGLTEEVRSQISAYIFEQSRKYLGRLN